MPYRLTFFGNNVKQILGQDSTTPAIEASAPSHCEGLGDGEFWPNVSNATAYVIGDDLYSEIKVARGYFTSDTGTTRQVIALKEGPVVVVDTVLPGEHADGWLGGPSWSVSAGVDDDAIHSGIWPAYLSRPNLTLSNVTSKAAAFDFVGFADVYSGMLSEMELLIVFPACKNCHHDTIYSTTHSELDPLCAATQACPLYESIYTYAARTFRSNQSEVFVSVLIPHSGDFVVPHISYSLSDEDSRDASGNNLQISMALGSQKILIDVSTTSWSVTRKL